MNANIENLQSLLESLGVNQSAVVPTETIQFNEEFHQQCKQNTCGSYNKNWMCPPAVGPFDELKAKALQYKQGLLFQTVHPLEDSFDIEGMQEGTQKHTEILLKVLDKIKRDNIFAKYLALNVGPCTYCGRCSILDGEACRFPDEAIASVEAYGMDVIALEKSCGMKYNNGPNTISCVSFILYNDIS